MSRWGQHYLNIIRRTGGEEYMKYVVQYLAFGTTFPDWAEQHIIMSEVLREGGENAERKKPLL